MEDYLDLQAKFYEIFDQENSIKEDLCDLCDLNNSVYLLKEGYKFSLITQKESNIDKNDKTTKKFCTFCSDKICYLEYINILIYQINQVKKTLKVTERIDPKNRRSKKVIEKVGENEEETGRNCIIM